MTYSTYIFLLDASIITITDCEKEEKNQFFKYYWRILLKFKEKILQILQILTLYKPLLTAFFKLNSLTSPCKVKPIEIHIP